MRVAFVLFLTLVLGSTAAIAGAPPQPATDASVPAPASSVQAPPDLEQIQAFTRVYDIIRKAYVEPVSNKALLQAAITGMLTQLDPHSAYLNSQGLHELGNETTGQYSGLGVVVTSVNGKLTVVSPIDGSPAARAGIKSGDIIASVNGTPVTAANMDASVDALRGKPGTKITLGILHTGSSKPVATTLTRARITLSSVRLHTLEPGYVYIRISQFQSDTGSQLRHKLTTWIGEHGQPKGAVLDLRSNPGGIVQAAVAVADAFLTHGTIVSLRGRLESSNVTFSAQPGDLLRGAPMVALVNHGTASAAEIVAGALKDHHRAVIIGRRTFGKGVVQTIIPVGATHALKLTTARYFTPDGTSIQAEGITPDIVIPDLVAQKDAAGSNPEESEADLPHHLANTQPASVASTRAARALTLADASALAERDYALAQALGILKGMALEHARAPRLAPANAASAHDAAQTPGTP